MQFVSAHRNCALITKVNLVQLDFSAVLTVSIVRIPTCNLCKFSVLIFVFPANVTLRTPKLASPFTESDHYVSKYGI